MDKNEPDLGLGVSKIASGAVLQSSQNIGDLSVTAPGKFRVVRRNGSLASFDIDKISVAMTKAFLAVEGTQAAASSRIHQIVSELTDNVFNALSRNIPDGGTFHIEDIQDQVELALMRGCHQKVARSYVLYREQRNSERLIDQTSVAETSSEEKITINSQGTKNYKKNRSNYKSMDESIKEMCSVTKGDFLVYSRKRPSELPYGGENIS